MATSIRVKVKFPDDENRSTILMNLLHQISASGGEEDRNSPETSCLAAKFPSLIGATQFCVAARTTIQRWGDVSACGISAAGHVDESIQLTGCQ